MERILIADDDAGIRQLLRDFLEDEGYELVVFHSHLSSPPRPSRTDVENIGLWQGKPYLILSVGSDVLAGWTIADGRIEPLAVIA